VYCQTQVSVTVETTLSKRIHIYLIPVLLLLSAATSAQWSEFPTGDLDSHTMRIQAKAESLYVSGDYKRARIIYVNELATIGDKYAQYMTGYMYLMGQGVPEDPVRASAWYRIAAERQAPEFIVVRDELIRVFDAQQLASSNAIYLELRKKFSDIVIVMRLLEEDMRLLDIESTGSRVSGGSSLVSTFDPRRGTLTSAELHRDRVRRTQQSRVDFVTGQLDVARLDADLTDAQIAELWELIGEQVAVIDDDVHRLVATP
jgi:hypothetical protein